jgi:hypothetical protein
MTDSQPRLVRGTAFTDRLPDTPPLNAEAEENFPRHQHELILVTTQVAAGYLRIPAAALEALSAAGIGPLPVTSDGLTLYALDDVRAFQHFLKRYDAPVFVVNPVDRVSIRRDLSQGSEATEGFEALPLLTEAGLHTFLEHHEDDLNEVEKDRLEDIFRGEDNVPAAFHYYNPARDWRRPWHDMFKRGRVHRAVDGG